MRLSELKNGEKAVVVKILGHGAFRKRVIEMGFVRSREVKVVLDAPLKDPINYEILGYNVSLRRAEAEMIEVEPIESANFNTESRALHERLDEYSEDNTFVGHAGRVINVALVGNPNCGKTSLYNRVSNSNEHVGNYGGVTVDIKDTSFNYKGYTIKLIDLPGTYSLSAYSPEELYVRRHMSENCPDVVLNVVDASNLERNLYLTTELIDMNRSMVIALNMYDELRAQGSKLNHKMLGDMIGVPMVPIVAKSGEGVEELLDTVVKVYEGSHEAVRHIHVNLGQDIEKAVRVLVDLIKSNRNVGYALSPRYIAIKLLEGDREVENSLKEFENFKQMENERNRLRAELERLNNEDITSTIAAEKYGFIKGALAETMEVGTQNAHKSTSLIDRLVTNKYLGFPIFFAIMFFIFWATFFIGSYPMEWIESGVEFLNSLIRNNMPDGMLKDLITDGIIGGVGGVIVFLPNIIILYFCISFMEDSGYMARAAFIMDKLMHRFGVHGKSFPPLLMGFGCNVPAIIASRTIESRSSRLITILINPFMSCSARLPLYVLLIGMFFSEYAALTFMGLYLSGIMVAIITARLLRRFIFHKDETPFVMELPPYRLPTLKASVRHTWHKGAQYLKKMGGIILFASVIVWVLDYFPRHDNAPGFVNETSEINLKHDSYLEAAGKFVNPIMEPLGFNWRASVAALAGVPAKEIVVSTLGVLYTNDADFTDESLAERMTMPHADGHRDFTPAVALSFMIFILLYCPCMATVTAVAKEAGSWRWGAFSVVYNTAVAWLVAFIVYNIALLF